MQNFRSATPDIHRKLEVALLFFCTHECPLKIEIHMRAEVGFFQVEEVLIPKIQSSPAKSLLELYAGVEGEEMKRYM